LRRLSGGVWSRAERICGISLKINRQAGVLPGAPRRSRGTLENGQIACAPVSPVRMRMTSSIAAMKILPSPIRPVWAER